MKKHISLYIVPVALILFSLLLGTAFADVGKKGEPKRLQKTTNWDEKRIDVGRIWLPITNYGKHGQDKWGHRGEWPGGSANEYIFGAGIIVGGIVNGKPCVSVGYDPNDASTEFVPGIPPNNWPSMAGTPKDDGEVIYLSTDPARPWPLNPASLPAGAPPPPKKIVSDLDTWGYFNDLADKQHKSEFSTPLGVMVVQTTYAWAAKGFEDIVFVIWDVVNIRSDHATIKDVFIGPNVDSDIGDATKDMVGFDLKRNLAYQYHVRNTEGGFVRPVGMLGYKFLEGPIATRDVDGNGDGNINNDSVMVIYHGIAGKVDTLYVKDVKKGQHIGMTAFKKYTIQIDPSYDWQRYAMLKGYDYRKCSYDVASGTLTTPGTAWAAFDEDQAPEDKRFVESTGPFDLAYGDTVRVVVAVMVNGVDDVKEIEADPLANLKKLQQTADLSQTIYDAGYVAPRAPLYPNLSTVPGDRKVTLIWDDRSERDPDPYYPIAQKFDPAYVEYDFEGYRIYRSPTGVAGSWTLLAEFDKTGDPDRRLIKNEATGEAYFVHVGNNTGLVHSYVDSGLVNGMTYYYAVTAYDFQPVSTPVSLESGKSNIVVVRPSRPLLGTVFGNVSAVQHKTGAADATVQLFVGDYRKLSGHTYEVTFAQMGADTIGWNLTDKNSGQVFVRKNTVYNLADKPADIPGVGFSVVVNNPSPGMKAWEYVPSSNRWFTWVNGDLWGLEGFSGAMGWGGHFFGSSVPATGLRNVEVRFAAADTTGAPIDPNDPNASMAYRYLRRAGDPAKPEFAPFIVVKAGGYPYQDFVNKIPLAAYDMESNPPRRLAVGFQENNTEDGNVNGKFMPRFYDDKGNNASREFLYIFDAPYSTTENPALKKNMLNEPGEVPIMWVWTASRRSPTGAPKAGDKFVITANHPASPADVFSFSTSAMKAEAIASDLSKVKAVPNPFVVRNDWMPSADYGVIYFTNLPNRCTIRIFTLAGDLVQILEKDDDSGQRKWDVTSYNHQDIASGVYFAHIDAPGIGSKIIKFAVVK